MFNCVQGMTLCGLEGFQVGVEADMQSGLPSFDIVGLPASSVREARERVRSALVNSGFQWPRKRIVVNLTPADVKKDTSGLDLPMAMAVLIASEQLPPLPADTILLGELTLDGRLHTFRGAWTAARRACGSGARKVLIPRDCADDMLIHEKEVEVYPVETLLDAVATAYGRAGRSPALGLSTGTACGLTPEVPTVDMQEIVGQKMARRALEIAAVGGHHLVMMGPPGGGKSMLAERFRTLLPPLTIAEWIEVRQIYSVASVTAPASFTPPFRAPHHSISLQGLLGGGVHPHPGEVSLAHNGVLFLDELPEFPRSCLEGLRQPIESSHITISRASYRCDFPSRFQLLAAMNPCPCGHCGSRRHSCACDERDIARYRSKLSGPMRDRIDMTVWMEDVSVEEILHAPGCVAESSRAIRERILHVRAWREQRETEHDLPTRASDVPPSEWLVTNGLTAPAQSLLLASADAVHLSMRGIGKVVRVARTIADMSLSRSVDEEHIAEAIQYRDTV